MASYPTPPHTPTHYALKPTARAYASTARLNLQHYLWKDQTGYLVHPSIPLSNPNLKIADVGTGTGIWLIDLAKTLPPTVQLDGFDIDIAHCPPQEWLPLNVHFHQLDILGEVPEHLVGVYDVIQLRLFQVVVKDNDPIPLLQNVLKMLKPGGHLQWGEYDMTTNRTLLADPALSASTLDAVPAFTQSLKSQESRVGQQSWIPTLPTTFTNQGLTSITTSRHPPSLSSLPYDLDVFLLTYEELSYKTLDAMQSGLGEKLRELIEKASQDSSRGVAWAMERVVVVGRKGEVGEVGERGKVGEVVVDEEDGVERGGKDAKDVGVGNGHNVEGKDDGKLPGKKAKGRKRQSWLKVWKKLGFGRGG